MHAMTAAVSNLVFIVGLPFSIPGFGLDRKDIIRPANRPFMVF
jgi:hypothetical protein